MQFLTEDQSGPATYRFLKIFFKIGSQPQHWDLLGLAAAELIQKNVRVRVHERRMNHLFTILRKKFLKFPEKWCKTCNIP